MLGLGILSYFLISQFLVRSVRVSGVSMVPTLHDSERYLLNRWIFHFRCPRRADIVVLQDPADHGFSVKRVIAVGGDSVSFKRGEVYVNGEKIAETYLAPRTLTFPHPRTAIENFTCAPEQYFVLGDNRNNSVDSRAYGPVPRRNILGLITR